MEITLEQICKALCMAADWHKLNNGHDERVASMSIKIGQAIGLDDRQLAELKASAMLHDIGRVGIDDNILQKRSRLTEAQRGAIEKHPEIGYKIVKAIEILSDDICNGVLCHHEHFDGTGYPQGLQGKVIPLYARIITIPDVYDALTSERPYRKALDKQSAIHIMNLEKSYFDPDLYSIFLEIIENE